MHQFDGASLYCPEKVTKKLTINNINPWVFTVYLTQNLGNTKTQSIHWVVTSEQGAG